MRGVLRGKRPRTTTTSEPGRPRAAQGDMFGGPGGARLGTRGRLDVQRRGERACQPRIRELSLLMLLNSIRVESRD